MAPHSSTLAWKIPWTQEPGRLQSRARLSDFTFTFHFHALEEDMATHSRAGTVEYLKCLRPVTQLQQSRQCVTDMKIVRQKNKTKMQHLERDPH